MWEVIPGFRGQVHEGAPPLLCFWVCVGCVLVREWQNRDVLQVGGSKSGCSGSQGQCSGELCKRG